MLKDLSLLSPFSFLRLACLLPLSLSCPPHFHPLVDVHPPEDPLERRTSWTSRCVPGADVVFRRLRSLSRYACENAIKGGGQFQIESTRRAKGNSACTRTININDPFYSCVLHQSRRALSSEREMLTLMRIFDSVIIRDCFFLFK